MKIRRTLTQQFFTIFILLFNLNFLIGDDGKNDIHTVRIVIPKVALLDIEADNTKNITLKMIAPNEAGKTLLSANDDRIWLNVTSVVESGSSRNITVRIDEPIDGIDLQVVSEAYAGQGYGSWGTPQPKLKLNTADQVLVSGIKSGETGEGTYSGYHLKYIAKSKDTDFNKISSNSGKDIVVIYTLTH